MTCVLRPKSGQLLGQGCQVGLVAWPPPTIRGIQIQYFEQEPPKNYPKISKIFSPPWGQAPRPPLPGLEGWTLGSGVGQQVVVVLGASPPHTMTSKTGHNELIPAMTQHACNLDPQSCPGIEQVGVEKDT